MKRQILTGLTIMLISFLIGGSYIIYAIGDATNQLERAFTMHKVQDSIEKLQFGLENVETSLKRKEAPKKAHLDLLRTDIGGLKSAIESCMHCEFSKQLIANLNQLEESNEDYYESLTQVLTLPPSTSYDQALGSNLRQQGSALGDTIAASIQMIKDEFPGRSQTLYHDITKVKHLIIFLVIAGPIAVLALTAFFLKQFTGSTEILVRAVNRFKDGNLNYRIDEKLKFEFHDLAESFNNMADSLKRQREDLQAAQMLYRTLFESAGEGIFILDLSEEGKGRIVSANPAAAEMHGYKVEELPGMNIVDVSCDDKCPERMQCALQGSWMQYVVDRRKKDGTAFLAEVSVGLLDMQAEKYALVFSRDITQKRKEEAELQHANQMALVGEMAAGLAHEIKNPLAGIKVSLEVLADELDLNDDDQELFTRIINETNRVEKLLKGLLNYARPPELHCEPFDLHKLLDNTIKNIALKGKTSSKEGVEFRKHYAAGMPLVDADSSQLQQVFLNIFLNAIEAMPDGGLVDVSTTQVDENNLLIKIKDTGKGISDNALKTIFQPFVTTKSRGTGLGLAISKRIIEEHFGTIEAVSGDHDGTLFTILLPFSHNRMENIA